MTTLTTFQYDGRILSVENGSISLQLENVENEEFYSLDYSSIIEFLHPNILWIFVKDDDYSGDFFAAGHDTKGKFYFIQGSFGSCSGCDWLQDIDTIDEAKKLLDFYKKEIIEKKDLDSLISYLRETVKNVGYNYSLSLEILISCLSDKSKNIEDKKIS
jgi:hypothetical protein